MGSPGIAGWVSLVGISAQEGTQKKPWSLTTGLFSPTPCRTQNKFEPHLFPCIQEFHGSQGLVCLVLCSNQLDALCSCTGFDIPCVTITHPSPRHLRGIWPSVGTNITWVGWRAKAAVELEEGPWVSIRVVRVSSELARRHLGVCRAETQLGLDL